jgi:hypothetical protein
VIELILRRASGAVVIVGFLLLIDCGQREPLKGPVRPADRFFDPTRIIEVEIVIDPFDWDALRSQTRTWWDAVAVPRRQCLSQPFPSPFVDYPGTVTVDGVRRENVGVRKKGFLGSLDAERPALRLKFDYSDPNQSLYGLTRLSLSNSVQDPSYVRQCLAYRVFEAAGVPAPRCNFAHIRVNGRDLGLYVNVEAIDKSFLRRYFDDESGDLWEGEYSDFRHDWVGTFEKKTNEPPDGDQRKADRSALAAVADAASENTPDWMIADRLSRLIELDEFLSYWAAEVVLEHWDGYANNNSNFFVYQNPETERFTFIPWGTDQITVPDPFAPIKPPPSVYATGILCRRLYRAIETRDLYLDRLRFVLDNAFKETELLAEIDRMETLITPAIVSSGGNAALLAEAVEGVREFVRTRRQIILEDLAQGPHRWEIPLRASPCVDLVGNLEGAFGTSFGTEHTPARETGSSNVRGALFGQQIYSVWGGATAGYDPNAPTEPWIIIHVFVCANDGTDYLIWFGIDPEHFAPVDALDDDYVWGWMGNWNPATQRWTDIGSILGSFTLDQAAAQLGAPVSGRFSGIVVQW